MDRWKYFQKFWFLNSGKFGSTFLECIKSNVGINLALKLHTPTMRIAFGVNAALVQGQYSIRWIAGLNIGFGESFAISPHRWFGESWVMPLDQRYLSASSQDCISRNGDVTGVCPHPQSKTFTPLDEH